MAIAQIDIKLLWGRAGATCSLCKTKLTQAKKGATNIGHQAHIVGDNEGSARWESILSSEERDKYANLILLCGKCHDTIDKLEPESFPVEKLHFIKTEHELWVEQQLSAKDRWLEAQNIVYAGVIENTTDLCMFGEWDIWTSWLQSSETQIDAQSFDSLRAFRLFVMKVPFPDSILELNRACLSLSNEVELLRRLIILHTTVDEQGNRHADRFYKNGGRFNPNYVGDGRKFDDWQVSIALCVEKVTAIANWFSDVVRREYNPTFFVHEGYLSISRQEGLTFDSVFWVPKLDTKEIAEEPSLSLARLREYESRLEKEELFESIWH